MRRVLLPTVAVLAAILLQVTVLNNLPFPGGSPPDLVLVVVVAMALTSGPLEGALIGFAAGLAVDIAPARCGCGWAGERQGPRRAVSRASHGCFPLSTCGWARRAAVTG